MKRIAIAMAVAVALPGCTVQRELVPISGSRADGTVLLAYEVGIYQRAQVDRAAGQAAAQRTCAGWGYSGAEPFGGATERCVSWNGYGHCMVSRITVPYQCTGTPSTR